MPDQISLTKVILIGVLAGFCVFLQCTVWTLQVLLEERRALEQSKTTTTTTTTTTTRTTTTAAAATRTTKTTTTTKPPHKLLLEEQEEDVSGNHLKPIKSMDLSSSSINELHLNRLVTEEAPGQFASSGSKQQQAQAYWRIAVELWLSWWDPQFLVDPAATSFSGSPSSGGTTTPADWTTSPSSASSSTSSLVTNATVLEAAWSALEEAAKQGHAGAQFHYGAALASGILAGDKVQTNWQDSSNINNQQQQQAWLYWHMAAMAGNVEALNAMAYRLEYTAAAAAATATAAAATTTATTTTPGAAFDGEPATSCSHQLPYFRQAALAILDALESNLHSRAKVLPATDKHVLYQIHLHGGTPSKLEYHNKADESNDALQFYHLRAFSNTKNQIEQAASAAYTLANYYHYGVRGVPQNLTLAAKYYQRAAHLNHWEAAGQAGTFYLWGIGVPQNVHTAHSFFRMGMPLGITGCQRRYQAKLKRSRNTNTPNNNHEQHDTTELTLCDTESIHGMAILKLMGLPPIIQIDLAEAEELFTMARDQGSADAAYHHAMMKLGWGTHWQNYPLYHYKSHNNRNAQTTIARNNHDNPFMPWQTLKDTPPLADYNDHQVSLGEYQAAITDLTLAAGKGHVQARVRLGLLFADGVQAVSPSSGMVQTAVAKDCSKALKQFKWVTDNACPFRAKRLRHAYKQYVAGNTAASLLNYLMAAETGSTVGLLNAAFLLEQGECLSFPSTTTSTTKTVLTPVDCAKASARLWKAAAQKGHGEASLRVGDFYYYQRFREEHAGFPMDVGPFGWLRYILYPEESIPRLIQNIQPSLLFTKTLQWLWNNNPKEESSTCQADGAGAGEEETQQCSVNSNPEHEHDASLTAAAAAVTSDLEMAAHYYQLATETTDSARAHFNLGFLYEWGLGLKQDFPLAKRHYDLAVSSSSSASSASSSTFGTAAGAELPVAIALTAMTIHEKVLKAHRAWQAWWRNDENGEEQHTTTATTVRKLFFILWDHHLFNMESLVLIGLIVILLILLRMRKLQQHHARPPPRRR